MKPTRTPMQVEWERAVLRARGRGTSPEIELLRELVALRDEFERFARPTPAVSVGNEQ